MSLPDLAALVLRLAAAAIFIAQGQRKLLAAPDAPHGLADLQGMIARRGLPRPDLLARLVATVELVGGVAVLVGAGTRLAAVALAAVMLVAIVGFKRDAGFLGGWDWPFSVFALVVALGLLGAGRLSVDAALGFAY